MIRNVRVPVIIHLLVNLFVLVSVKELKLIGYVSHADVGAEVNLCFTLLTVLGSHDNHTVSGYRTVDSGCCTVFQYLHGLNILRVNGIDVTRETIDNVKGFVVTESFHTTDFHANTSTSITTGLLDIHTGNLTLQGLCRVSCGTL